MSNQQKEFISIESIRLDAELQLADFLFETEVISESAYKIDFIGSSSQALMESASRKNSPGYHYGEIHYVDFRNVWNNIRDYPTTEDVYRFFHSSTGSIASNTATNWVGRVLKKFLGEGSDPGVPEARKELVAKSTAERKKVEEKIRAGEIEEYEDEFGSVSIDGGYQRKSSRSGNIEKASTMFPGELYSDHTRIPKRRWGSWWKRFLRKKTSVANPEASLIAMRRWTKHFILGYQISRSLFYEIWYSTEDSSFSVHDKNGNTVQRGGNIPLMRDALNVLFHSVADSSPKDAEVLRMNSPDLRKVNQDIARALSGEVSDAQKYSERMRDRKKELIDLRKRDEERQRQKAEHRDRAAAETRGSAERKEEEKTDDGILNRAKQAAKDAAKEKMKDAVNKGIDNYKKASAERYARDAEGSQPADGSVEAGAENRRKARQAAASRNADGVERDVRAREQDQEEERRQEEDRLKAQSEAETRLQKAQQELADIQNDAWAGGEMSDIERTAYAAELRNEVKDVKDVIDELESGTEFDRKLRSELKKIENRQDKRRRNAKKKKKAPKDDYPLSDYEKKLSDQNGRSVNEEYNPFADEMNGSDDSPMDMENELDLSDYEQNPLYHIKANQEVENARNQAENSPYTQQLLNSMFLEGFVQMYEKTRVRDNRTFVRRIFDRLKIFRGRQDRIALPTRVNSSYRKLKGFFAGTQARADFIVGYTINDVADFEIWYVQEISADGKNEFSSFYLYDVTAMKILDGQIPYYRNAVQKLMLKIGSEATKGG